MTRYMYWHPGLPKPEQTQLEINCRWLVGITDRIHDVLCAGQNGTWQDRAKQAVEEANPYVWVIEFKKVVY